MALHYRGPSADLIAAVAVPPFTAVFHRPSGTTHLLAEPAPEILAVLADGAPMEQEAVMARLAPEQSPSEDDRDALKARLDELVAAGLVEAGPVGDASAGA